MNEKHWLLMICPTVVDGVDTYATFSCHADAAWLTLTGTIALIYLLTLLIRTLFLPTSKKMRENAVPEPMAKTVGTMDEVGV
jgi:hypothetical protein